MRGPHRGADEARRHGHGHRPARRVRGDARHRFHAERFAGLPHPPPGFRGQDTGVRDRRYCQQERQAAQVHIGQHRRAGTAGPDPDQEREGLSDRLAQGHRLREVRKKGFRAQGHHRHARGRGGRRQQLPDRRARVPQRGQHLRPAGNADRRAGGTRQDDHHQSARHTAGHRRAHRQPHLHGVVRTAQDRQDPAHDAGRGRSAQLVPPAGISGVVQDIPDHRRRGPEVRSRPDNHIAAGRQDRQERSLAVQHPDDPQSDQSERPEGDPFLGRRTVGGHGGRHPAPAHRRGADRRWQHPDAPVRGGPTA